MKKSFTDWPLDGQIGFVAIIISIAFLLFSKFANKREDYIAKRNGDFLEMKPLKSSFVMLLGMLILDIVATYALSQSGHHPNMTEPENANNKLIGMVVVSLFWIGTFYFLYSIFFTKCLFNREQIAFSSPLQKKIYKWQDFSGLGTDWKGYYIKFLSPEKFYLPYGRSGIEQLHNAVRLKQSHLTTPQSAPYYDSDILEKHFLGKSVIFILFGVNDDFIQNSIRSETGKISAIEVNKISITLDGGEVIKASATITSVDLLDNADMLGEEHYKILEPFIKSYTLPEAIATYYIEI